MAFYSDFNRRTHNTAQTLTELGFCVIPCQPNSKIAATPWKIYQTRRADDAQLALWFAQNMNYNLAIVTGSVSTVIVLDIDQERIYHLFITLFPHLKDTRLVKSPNGWHFYFSIPTGMIVRSRKGKGVDLQAEGSYVLAPPSVVDGKDYTIEQGGAPIRITPRDLKRLNGFLDEFCGSTVDNTQTPEKPRKSALSASERHSRKHLSLSGLKYRYQRIAAQDGRNNALFNTALLGRDLGYSQNAVEQALVEAHIHQPPNKPHRRESPAARQREAERTIASAFSRPPRPLHHGDMPEQLPNNMRYFMLHNKLMGPMRTLEGLRHQGIEQGDRFSRKQATEILEGIVGRDTIHNAVKTEVNGVPIFEKLPPDPQGLRCSDEMPTGNNSMLNCCGSKAGIDIFIMPSNEELAEKFGIALSFTSDPLTLDDLKSVKTVREQITQGFLEREPGQHSRKFVAKLTNVSISSYKRYMRALNEVEVTPTYTATPVTWWNLESAIPPDDMEIGGLFLVDNAGKRYQAKQGIARKLLGQKRRVELYRQRPNHYRVVKAEVDFSRGPTPTPQPVRTFPKPEPIIQYVAASPPRARPSPGLGNATTQKPLPGLNAPTKSPKKAGRAGKKKVPERVPKKRKISGKRKLKDPDAEHMAQHVYKTINEMTERKEDKISLRSARLMVHNYGIQKVDRALKQVQSRRKVRKPVGLLSTILRGERKFGKKAPE